MYFTSFSSEVAFLDVFLGIVPRSSGICHEDSEYEASGKPAYQQANDTRHAEKQTCSHRGNYGKQGRKDHFALCSLGRDLYASGVVGFGFTRKDSFDFSELTAHFFYHARGGTSYGVHRKSAEEECHHASDEHARQYFRVHQRHVVINHEIVQSCFSDRYLDAVGEFQYGGSDAFKADAHFFDIGSQEGKPRKGSRSDGESFPRGGGGIAQRVERIGTPAHFFAQLAHLGIASGVIGYRSVSVCGESDA